MKYEVEVEVCCIYGIEADDPHEAEIIAQMNVDSHAPYLERTIASIYVEQTLRHHANWPSLCVLAVNSIRRARFSPERT